MRGSSGGAGAGTGQAPKTRRDQRPYVGGLGEGAELSRGTASPPPIASCAPPWSVPLVPHGRYPRIQPVQEGEADCAFPPETSSGPSLGWTWVTGGVPKGHHEPPGEFPGTGSSGCGPDPASPPPGGPPGLGRAWGTARAPSGGEPVGRGGVTGGLAGGPALVGGGPRPFPEEGLGCAGLGAEGLGSCAAGLAWSGLPGAPTVGLGCCVPDGFPARGSAGPAKGVAPAGGAGACGPPLAGFASSASLGAAPSQGAPGYSTGDPTSTPGARPPGASSASGAGAGAGVAAPPAACDGQAEAPSSNGEGPSAASAPLGLDGTGTGFPRPGCRPSV